VSEKPKKAPQGRDSTAQGIALGERRCKPASPERAQ